MRLRAEYYYSDLPRRRLQSERMRRLHSRHRRRGRPSARTASSSAAPTCAASSSAASVRATPRRTIALGGNLYYVGSAEVRFPLGLPEELRIFGRAFVDAGSLRDIDVSGPTLDESDGLRVGTRRRAVLAVAARSALDRFRPGGQEGGQGQHRVLPHVVRHPVLMSLDAARAVAGRARRCCIGLVRLAPAPAAAARTLPPTVAAVIDYQRILRDARAARAIRDQVEAGGGSIRRRSRRRSSGFTRPTRSWPRQRTVLSPEAFADEAPASSRARWPQCSAWRRSAGASSTRWRRRP